MREGVVSELSLQPPAGRLARGRGVRVAMLVGFIALASVVDLHLTLTHLRSAGMIEANPIARWVIAMGCAWLLIAWKAAMLALTCSILLGARRRRSGELAAWVGAAIMVWLMWQWIGYAQQVGELTSVLPELAHAEHVHWVALAPD